MHRLDERVEERFPPASLTFLTPDAPDVLVLHWILQVDLRLAVNVPERAVFQIGPPPKKLATEGRRKRGCKGASKAPSLRQLAFPGLLAGRGLRGRNQLPLRGAAEHAQGEPRL